MLIYWRVSYNNLTTQIAIENGDFNGLNNGLTMVNNGILMGFTIWL